MIYKNLIVKQRIPPTFDIDLEKCPIIPFESRMCSHFPLLDARNSGEFESRAFGLNSDYDWIIGKDSQGVLVLVPQRKD